MSKQRFYRPGFFSNSHFLAVIGNGRRGFSGTDGYLYDCVCSHEKRNYGTSGGNGADGENLFLEFKEDPENNRLLVTDLMSGEQSCVTLTGNTCVTLSAMGGNGGNGGRGLDGEKGYTGRKGLNATSNRGGTNGEQGGPGEDGGPGGNGGDGGNGGNIDIHVPKDCTWILSAVGVLNQGGRAGLGGTGGRGGAGGNGGSGGDAFFEQESKYTHSSWTYEYDQGMARFKGETNIRPYDILKYRNVQEIKHHEKVSKLVNEGGETGPRGKRGADGADARNGHSGKDGNTTYIVHDALTTTNYSGIFQITVGNKESYDGRMIYPSEDNISLLIKNAGSMPSPDNHTIMVEVELKENSYLTLTNGSNHSVGAIQPKETKIVELKTSIKSKLRNKKEKSSTFVNLHIRIIQSGLGKVLYEYIMPIILYSYVPMMPKLYASTHDFKYTTDHTQGDLVLVINPGTSLDCARSWCILAYQLGLIISVITFSAEEETSDVFLSQTKEAAIIILLNDLFVSLNGRLDQLVPNGSMLEKKRIRKLYVVGKPERNFKSSSSLITIQPFSACRIRQSMHEHLVNTHDMFILLRLASFSFCISLLCGSSRDVNITAMVKIAVMAHIHTEQCEVRRTTKAAKRKLDKLQVIAFPLLSFLLTNIRSIELTHRKELLEGLTQMISTWPYVLEGCWNIDGKILQKHLLEQLVVDGELDTKLTAPQIRPYGFGRVSFY